jgi:hypothetical protein
MWPNFSTGLATVGFSKGALLEAVNYCLFVLRITVILWFCMGSGTWSLTLREEHRLRVFENRVLRIFGPKRDEVTGGWRKLHNEELHNFYSWPSIINNNDQVKEDEMGRTCIRNGSKDAYRILVGKHEEKRPLGRPRRRGRTILKWILER